MPSLATGVAGTAVPSASASTAEAAALRGRFFRLNPRRITIEEFRWGTSLPMLFIAVPLVKWMGLTPTAATDDLPVQTLEEFTVSDEALPSEASQKLAALRAEIEGLGFHTPTIRWIDDTVNRNRTALVTWAHRASPIVARLHWRHTVVGKTVLEARFTEFFSCKSDGTFLWSTSAKPDMKWPERCTVAREIGASPTQLLASHERLIEKSGGRSAYRPACNVEQALRVESDLHAAVRDFHVGRGVFVELTDELGDQRVAQSRHPRVYAEMLRAQQSRGTWVAAALMLLVSLGFFLLVGLSGVSSFTRLLLIGAVLFVHECGHYAAMRLFGYCNLKMFFIPGFGAAVTGRHFNVAGWKKAVVALAGPVPGILIALVLGIAGVAYSNKFLQELAFLSAVLNGFNLLPILPLDGGHVAQIVLFSRHPWADAVFRVAAAIGLGLLNAILKAPILIGIAVFLLLGVPAALRQDRISHQLRKDERFRSLRGRDEIAVELADVIVDRLAAIDKKPVGAKIAAARALSVYEKVNAVPTGWLSGTAVLIVHVVSFALAAVLAMGLIAAKDGSLSELIADARQRPAHALSSDAIHVSDSAASGNGPVEGVTVVGEFKSPAEAKQFLTKSSADAAGGIDAGVFGNVFFVRCPDEAAARERWMSRLESGGAKAYLQSRRLVASFRFEAYAPDEATAKSIIDECDAYLMLPHAAPIVAPWGDTARLTPEALKSRRTFARLQAVNDQDSAEEEKLNEEFEKALSRGDEKAMTRITDKINEVRRTQEIARVRALAEDTSGTIDQEMAAAYLLKLQASKPGEYIQLDRVFDPTLFGTDLRLGETVRSYRGSASISGWCFRRGLRLRFDYLAFFDPIHGPPRLIDWLEHRGCKYFRYDIRRSERDRDDEAESISDPDPAATDSTAKPEPSTGAAGGDK